MANYDNQSRYGATAVRGAVGAVDAGLRAHMLRVYNYMTGALALTGAASWAGYQAAGGSGIAVTPEGVSGLTPFGQLIFGLPGMLVLLFGTLGLVFFISARISRLQVGTALTLFLVYAGLLGLALSSVFVVYTGGSIARVFFISAATFGGMSLFGYTTARDLSAWGSFLMMGLFGVIIASVVNLFVASSALQFAVSIIGVLVFTGLTAYDTQTIKEMYYVGDDGAVAGRKAIMGALRLYLDFVNLFLMLLRLFGDRR